MLDGGIAYLTWHAFEITGNYSVTTAVKAVLDKAAAAPPRAKATVRSCMSASSAKPSVTRAVSNVT